MLQQISAALLTILQLLLALFGFPAKGTPQPPTDTPCVFVHGLGGWGNYDTVNEVAPYWGMTTGSLLAYLESEGYDLSLIHIWTFASPPARLSRRASARYPSIWSRPTGYV